MDQARIPVDDGPAQIKLLEGCGKSQRNCIRHTECVKGHAVRLSGPVVAQPFTKVLAKLLFGQLNLMGAGDQIRHHGLRILIAKVAENEAREIYAFLDLI